jgi:predicted Zn-dependent protease
MRKIIIEFIILLLIGSLMWAAFSLFIKAPEKPVLISKEKERILGQKYRDAILKLNGFDRIEDHLIDSIFSVTAEKMTSLITEGQYTFRITVVKNDLINAFALPGGHIIITSGIIEFCESAEELISVIAHESGHIVERHIISRLIKDLGMDLLGSDNNFVTAEIAKGIISSGYNRKQEEAADMFACELLEKAGSEPRILASFMRRIKDHEGENDLSDFEILSSHPDFDSRIRKILSYEVKNVSEPVIFFEIQELKDRIKQLEDVD